MLTTDCDVGLGWYILAVLPTIFIKYPEVGSIALQHAQAALSSHVT